MEPSRVLVGVLAACLCVGAVYAVTETHAGSSTASGTGLSSATVGFARSLTIQSRDVTGAAISDANDEYDVTLTGPASLWPVASDIGSGQKNAEYMAYTPGEYSLNVGLRGPVYGMNSLQLDDQQSQYVSITGQSHLLIQTFTVELWFRTGLASSTLLSYNGKGMMMRLLGGVVQCWAMSRDIAPDHADSAKQYADGVWHHAACTNDASELLVYMDGGPQESLTCSYANNRMPLNHDATPTIFIGRRSAIDGEYFKGNIDEVRIWNVSLSASDVYKRMKWIPPTPCAYLVGYWALNDGPVSTTAADLSGFGVTGTVLNSPTWATNTPALMYSNARPIQASPYTITMRENASPVYGTGTAKSIPYTNAEFYVQAQDVAGANMTTGGDRFAFKWSSDGISGGPVVSVDGGNGVYTMRYNLTDRGVYQGIVSRDVFVSNAAALTLTGSATIVFNSPGYVRVNTFTLEAWFKSTVTTATMTMIRQEPSGFYLQLGSNQIRCIVKNELNTGLAGTSAETYADGIWHHAACTYATGTNGIKVYVDGVFKDENTLTGVPDYLPSYAFTIGGESESSSSNFQGSLDEIRIWSTVRSAADIAEYRNRRLAGDETGLVGYFPLDEGTGIVVHSLASTHPFAGAITGTGATWATTGLPTLLQARPLPLAASPLRICADFVTNPALTTVSGGGISSATAGVTAHFQIQMYNERGDPKICAFLNTATVETSGPVALSATMIEDLDGTGRYNASYVPTIAGTYSFVVKTDGTSAVGSPYAVTVVAGAPNAAKTYAYGSNLAAGVAGQAANVLVQVADMYGNNRTTEGGTITAQLVGRATQSVTVTYQSSGIYKLSWSFTEAGQYALEIRLDGSHIMGSPFSYVHNPDVTLLASTYTYGGGLQGALAGEFSPVVVQARDQYLNNQTHANDVFAVVFDASASATVAVTSVAAEGRYYFMYNITALGAYSFNVTLAGVNVPGCPFVTTVTPGPTYAPFSIATGTGLSGSVAGVEASFSIASWDKFGHAKTNTDDGWVVQLTGAATVSGGVSSTGPGAYAVTYTSNVSGNYQIAITLGGVHLAGSPFSAVIVPGPASTPHCIATASVASGVAGENNTFDIQVRDQYDNNLLDSNLMFTVTVTGPASPQPTVTYVGSALFHASYYTTVSGTYTITVQNGTTHISGSPFTATVAAAATDGPMSVVTGTALGGGAIAGVTRQVLIQCKDRFGNLKQTTTDTIVVRLAGPAVLESNAVSTAGGQYESTLYPTVSGSYSLSVTIGGVSMGSSPWAFSVTPNVTRTNICMSLGMGAYRPIAGELSHFFIQSRDAFGNNVTDTEDTFVVAISGHHVIPTTQSYLGSGIHRVLFNETLSGSYTMTITRGGENIASSPWSMVVVAAEPYGPSSYFWGQFNYTMTAGDVGEFTIRGVDVWGNNCTEPNRLGYTIRLDGPKEVYGFTTYLGDGTYRGLHNASVSGKYVLSVSYNGLPLLGSPAPGHIVIYRGPPYGPLCLATGAGASQVTAGVSAELAIQTRDGAGNNRTQDYGPFTIHLTGPETRGPVNSTYDTAGIHTWSYMVTKAGQYSLSVVFTGDGKAVLDSPFSVQCVSQGAVLANTATYGAGVTTSTAGELAAFVVQAVDLYGNNVTYAVDTVTAVLTGPATVTGRVADTQGGRYTMVYNATVSGTYSLAVSLNGNAVPGSPFTVTVSPAAMHGLTSVASGAGLTSALAGETAMIRIDAKDIWGNARTSTSEAIAVQLTGPATVAGTATNESPGVFLATYVATLVGQYSLALTLNGQPIASSPYSIAIAPNVSYTPECIALGSAAHETVAGVAGAFTIQERDKYQNNVTATTTTPAFTVAVASGPGSITFTVTPGSDGVHAVTYMTTLSGEYSVAITRGTTHIAGSPMTLVIKPSTFDWTKTHVFGDGVNFAGVGDQMDVFIQMRDIYGNNRFTPDATYVVAVTGTQSVAPQTSAYFGNGVAVARYRVTELGGTYVVNVTYLGQPVPNSPFTVMGVPGKPSMTNSYYCDVTRGLKAGDVTTLLVQLVDSLGNNRSVAQAGDDIVAVIGTGPVTVRANGTYIGPGGSYTVALRTTTSGTYRVGVIVNEAELTSSPLAPDLVIVPDVRDAGNALAFGSGAFGGEETYTLTLYIQERDQFGNNVTTGGLTYAATITRSGTSFSLTLSVAELGGGLYVAHYSIATKGTYTLTVLVNGSVPIANSPAAVVIAPYTPLLVSATYSASRGVVHVKYNRDTNRAQQVGAFACGHVLDAATVGLLGTDAWCTYRTNDTLGVFLGHGATLAVSSAVVVLGGKVRNGDDDSAYVVGESLPLSAPAAVPAPAAVVAGTARIGSCGNLMLDASQSRTAYGGVTKYEWAVPSATPSAANLDLVWLGPMVGAMNGSMLTLATSNLRAGGQYVFRLTVTDAYGATATADHTVTRLEDAPPTATIAGPAQQSVMASQDIVLTGSVDGAAACVGGSRELLFAWSQVSGPTALDLSSATSRVLHIAAETLTAGGSYVLRFNATFKDDPASSGYADVTLAVADVPVVAMIAGGDRSVPAGMTYELDAAASTPVSGATRLFTWSCTVSATGAPCSGLALPTSSPSASKITVSSLPAGQYVFNATVAVSGRGQSTALARVEVLSSTTGPSVGITEGSLTVAAEDSVVLNGYSDVDVVFTWAIREGDVTMPTATGLTTATAARLALPAGSLVGGQTVVVRLVGTDGSGNVGYADATIVVTAPPVGGQCMLSAVTGVQTDSLTVSCAGWTEDSADDYPLSYACAAVLDGGAEMTLHGETLSPAIPVTLPVGSPVTVAVTIQNRARGRARVALTATITAATPTGTPPAGVSVAAYGAGQMLDETVAAALRVGDYAAVSQGLMGALSLLNAATATTAADLSSRQSTRARVVTAVTDWASAVGTSTDDETVQTQLLILCSSVAAPSEHTTAGLESVAVAFQSRLDAAVPLGFPTTTTTTRQAVVDALSNVMLGLPAPTAAAHGGYDALVAAGTLLVRTSLHGAQPGQTAATAMAALLSFHGQRLTPNAVGRSVAQLGMHTVSLGPAILDAAATGSAALAHIDAEVIAWGRDPFVWSGTEMGANVTSVVLRGPSGGVVTVSGNTDKANVMWEAPFQGTIGAGQGLSCEWWDAAASAWSADNCAAQAASSSSPTSILCNCSHLTEFSGRVVAVPVVSQCGFSVNTPQFFVLVCLGGLMLAGILVAALVDSSDAGLLPKMAGTDAVEAKYRAVAALVWRPDPAGPPGGQYGRCLGAVLSYHGALIGIGPTHGVRVQFKRPERVVVAFAALLTSGCVVAAFGTSAVTFGTIPMRIVASVVGGAAAVVAGVLLGLPFMTLEPHKSKPSAVDATPGEDVAMVSLGPRERQAVAEARDEIQKERGCCGNVPRTVWRVVLFYVIALVWAAAAAFGQLQLPAMFCWTYAHGVEWLVWWSISIGWMLVIDVVKAMIMAAFMSGAAAKRQAAAPQTAPIIMRQPDAGDEGGSSGDESSEMDDLEAGVGSAEAGDRAGALPAGSPRRRKPMDLPGIGSARRPEELPPLSVPEGEDTEEEESEGSEDDAGGGGGGGGGGPGTPALPMNPLVEKTLQSLKRHEYEELEGVESTPLRKLPPIGARSGVGAVAGFTVDGEDTTEGFVPRSPWQEEQQEDEMAMARRFRQAAYSTLSEKQIVRYFASASRSEAAPSPHAPGSPLLRGDGGDDDDDDKSGSRA